MKLVNGLLVIAVLTFPAVTFADSKSKAPSGTTRVVHKSVHKACTVRFGGSAFPQPCDRVGEMPATAEPMRIIGKLPSSRDIR